MGNETLISQINNSIETCQQELEMDSTSNNLALYIKGKIAAYQNCLEIIEFVQNLTK